MLDRTAQFDHALGDARPDLRVRLRAVIGARSPIASFSFGDLTVLEHFGMTASATPLLDLTPDSF